MKRPCSGTVYGGRTGSFRCASPATREWQGKWWCFHHDPREKEKKRKAWDEKWERGQKEDDEKKAKADKLLKRLGVEGCIAYHWKRGYHESVTIRFEEVEKILKELGR